MSKKITLTTDLAHCLATLSDSQAGQLFRAVFDYHDRKPVSPECPVVAAMFTVFKSHFDKDIEKSNDISMKRRISGTKGGEANGSKWKQMEAIASPKKAPKAEITTFKSPEYMPWAKAEIARLATEKAALWAEAYPAVDIKLQCAKALDWLEANPTKRKTKLNSFMSNWLGRAQERPQGGYNTAQAKQAQTVSAVNAALFKLVGE